MLAKKPPIWRCLGFCRLVAYLQSKEGREMAMQVITIDRREHPSEGIMGHLADITYGGLLRKYEIGEVKTAHEFFRRHEGISVNL